MTTYNMDLAEDALEAALTYVAPRILDEKGNRIAHNYNKILVPDNLIPTVKRLMLSQGRVGSMDNDTNIHKDEFEIVKLPLFNSSGSAYWFLLDDNYNDLRIKFSQKPILEGPELIFDKLKSILWETIIKKFRKFRETLKKLETILSEVLYNFTTQAEFSIIK